MWHSCGSRNPGCFVYATVFLRGKWELGKYFLDSRFRGNDTLGLTRQGRGGLVHS